MLRLIRSTLERVRHSWDNLSASVLMNGATSAAVLGLLALQWFTRLGTSTPVVLGSVGAFVGALALGVLLPAPATHPGRLAGRLGALAGLTLWVVVSPRSLGIVCNLLLTPRWIHAEAPALNAIACALAAVLYLGVPAILVSRLYLAAGFVRKEAQFLWSAAIGYLAVTVCLSQWIGPYTSAVVALLPTILRAGWEFWRERSLPTATICNAPSNLESEQSTAAPGIAGAVVLLQSLAAGLSLGALGEVWSQLMPATAYLTSGVVLGLLAGAAGGRGLAQVSGVTTNSRRTALWISALVLALLPVAVVATFPELVRLCLWGNARISSTGFLATFRTAIPALGVFPLAAAWMFLVTSQSSVWSRRRRIPVACVVIAATGWGLSYTLGRVWGGPVPVLLVCAWCGWGVAVAAAWTPRRSTGGLVTRFAGAGLALVLLCTGTGMQGRYNPALSARLLFSTSAFASYGSGMRYDLLPYLDEARLIQTARGEKGVYTTWKYGGRQYQIRGNGLPLGVASLDARLFPRHLPETLGVALPLVLHEHPERMMLLGLGTGESLVASMAFPVAEVVCCELDSTLLELVQSLGRRAGHDFWNDTKLRIQTCDPVLALASHQALYDVIVSEPDSLALLQSQSSITVEFYSQAAGRLEDDGVFCQRLTAYDLGPEPVRVVVQSMQQAFRDVMIVEAAAGEFLCLGTNSSKGLLRDRLTRRLQQMHVRKLLAESGFDWAAILNLPAVESSGLAEFSGAAGLVINASASSLMPLGLPREVMRWGAKNVELARALEPVGGRLLNWLGDEASQPDLLRRLSELKAQQDLMNRYSSQFWAYRASVRDQVSNRPRSQIQPVALGEPKRMHPEDLRRLSYFEALGQAVRSKSREDIALLDLFEQPYDPLLTYFLHQEAAELHRYSPQRDPTAELQHRLHTTWFSSPRDASLKNVVAALELLRDHPEAEPDPEQRWDDFNALLQALQLRWQARSGVKPSTPRAGIADIDQSLAAVEKTVRVMEQLTREAGIPYELWEKRREALDRTLVRPALALKNQLLPYALRREAAVNGVGPAEEADAPPPPAKLTERESSLPTAP